VSVDKHQTAAVMGFPGVPATDDARHALDLIAEITSGLAGRFFQAVRGDNGLAYAVSSFHRARMFGGSFITYTATSPDKEEAARAILLKECARLRDALITPAEIDSGKAAIRGERATGLQTFSAQAGELAVSRLYGLPVDAGDRYVERIESLTAEELRESAATYLVEDRIWIGAVRGAVSSG
jgi:zinc protease